MRIGFNLDLQNKNGTTALMYAISMNNVEIAKLLITSGCKLDLQNNNGCAALMIAVIVYRSEFVELLITN